MADVLGAFEQAVLLGIVRLGEGAYGRAILKDVQDHLLRPVAPGAVHATLTRLEARGLVSSRLGSGTPIRGGRARRGELSVAGHQVAAERTGMTRRGAVSAEPPQV